MGTNEYSEAVRLRRQRNLAAVTAVIFIVLGLAVALPPALKRRKDLLAANNELLSMQGAIGNMQARIQDVQAKIVTSQAEIRALLDEQRRRGN